MNKNLARILLLFVFMARGCSFLFSKILLRTVSPMSILAVRFLLSFLVLSLIFPQRLLRCSRESLRGGVVLGLLYTVLMTFEMFGLRLIDSGVSALIEHMAIVLVPLFLAVLTQTPPRKKTMLCALLAVIGVGFLSLSQNRSENTAVGIMLILLAAVTYAVCIILTEKVSQNADPLTIGMVQLGVMGIASFVAALPFGGFSLPRGASEWIPMLLLVGLCSCFGYAFQPLGQKYLPAEEAAVLTVANPFTASILGVAAAGESLSVLKLIGYALILTALLLYHRNGRRA